MTGPARGGERGDGIRCPSGSMGHTGAMTPARRRLLIACSIILLAVILFQAGAVPVTAYRAETNSTIGSITSAVRRFRGLSRIVLVHEDGDERTVTLGKEGGILRLTVKDRFSHWPWTSWVPGMPFGSSVHRIYLNVERSQDGTGWNNWGSLIPITATVDMRARGLISMREYRRAAVRGIVDGIPQQIAKEIDKPTWEGFHHEVLPWFRCLAPYLESDRPPQAPEVDPNRLDLNRTLRMEGSNTSPPTVRWTAYIRPETSDGYVVRRVMATGEERWWGPVEFETPRRQ
ncbi:MAG TPA: hypothetical protein VFF61_07840 [Microvirga sp.]|nr:hypothetical protein [Microvirga sp.]